MVLFNDGLYFLGNLDSSAGQLWSFRGFPSAVDNVKNKENTFSLYPNPASSYCTIKTQQAYTTGSVAVYDVAGRMILRKNITGDTNNISLKSMPKGVYTVSAILDDKITTQQLVVE